MSLGLTWHHLACAFS